MLGLTFEDLDDATEVWPDSVPATRLFCAMATQWRAGMSGATGLDYGVLPAVMELLGIAPDERPGVFEDVRVMESEALKVMHERT